jgi:outer membrane protein assembly factor BamB
VSTEVLIELDAPLAPVDRRSPPAHQYRGGGLAFAALLVLTLAGAVPSGSPLWRRDGIAPIAGAGAMFQVAGDRLYVSVARRGERSVTAWAAHPFRTLWTALIPAGDADRLEVQSVPGRVLVRVTRSERGPSTTALDARTGAVVWTVAHDVQPLPGGHTGLQLEQVFRTGTRYDEASGAPGQLWFAETGDAYSRPPDRSVLRGLDLLDGRQRWTKQWRGSIFAAPAAASPPGVVVVSAERIGNVFQATGPVSQRLELLDADTGELHRTRLIADRIDASVADGGSAINVQVTDGLLVLVRSTWNGSVRTAFGLGELDDRWRLPYVGVGTSRFCAGVPCVETPDGLSILDPATAAVRWKVPGSADVVGRGGHAVELNLQDTAPAPRRVVDPAAGTTLVDLAGWPTTVAGAADAPLVLAAPDDRGGTAFAVLPAGERSVRPLGRADTVVADCQADARVIACRVADGVELFEYRP